MKITDREHEVLKMADNEESFLIEPDVRKKFGDESQSIIDSLESKGCLAFYDSCYWITYEGEGKLTEGGEK